jgi:hypothetical protein
MSFDDPDDDFLSTVPKPERKIIPKQYDAPLRFTVPSSSRPGEVHLVDLGALGANGFCSCEDFRLRKESVAKSVGPSDRARCRHILLTRAWFLDKVLNEMNRQK